MIKSNLLAAAGPGTESIRNPALGTLGSATGRGVSFFTQFVPNMVGLVFIVGIVIFVFMLLMAGIQWITAGGDKQALEGAKGRLTQALVGIFIMLSVFAIVKLVETLFGINILSVDIGPLIIK